MMAFRFVEARRENEGWCVSVRVGRMMSSVLTLWFRGRSSLHARGQELVSNVLPIALSSHDVSRSAKTSMHDCM